MEINKKLNIDTDIEFLDTGYSDQLYGKRYLFLGHKQKLGIVAETWQKLYATRKYYKNYSIYSNINRI